MNFSVLMSIYYKEIPLYLKECLDSVIDQTVRPSEIVIVKDGPLTLELDNLLNAYTIRSPELFKIVELPENVGLGKALSIGILNCSHDLIARMDSDDVARRDRFQRQLFEFEKDRNLDIVGSQIIEFEGTIDKVLAKRVLPISNDQIWIYARRRNPFNHVTVMYKKESVINAGNYIQTFGAGFEDYLLWIKMFSSGCNGKNIDDYLVYVRTDVAMFTRRGGIKYLVNAIRFRFIAFRLGFVGVYDTLISILANIIVSISPRWLRKNLYYKYLRSH